jgi:hypothetical protein
MGGLKVIRHNFEPLFFTSKNKPLESNFLIFALSVGQDNVLISRSVKLISYSLQGVKVGVHL